MVSTHCVLRRAILASLCAAAGLLSVTLAGQSAPVRAPTGAESADGRSDPAVVSGVVIDTASGRPLVGAVVTLRATGPLAAGRAQLTDAQGRFLMSDLPAAP